MKTRPNIILLLPDQWRGEALGCMGNQIVKTPNVDALASEGVAFSNCVTQNTVCTPSRCSLITGWYPHVAGHRTMHHFVRRHEPNLLRYLKDSGYYVWWGGKNDMIPVEDWDLACDERVHGKGKKGPSKPAPKFGDRHFYTFYRGAVSDEPMYLDDDDVIAQAAEFLNGRAGIRLRESAEAASAEELPACQQKPFFMWINQGFPHPPYFAEREWCDMYPPEKMRMIPAVLEGKPGILDAIRRKTGCDKLTEGEFRLIKSTYYAMVSRTDRNLGIVLDAVKQAGLWDSTAIFMTSDHGDFAGDYRLVEKTQNTFDDVLVRIPLIARVPINRDATYFSGAKNPSSSAGRPKKADLTGEKIARVPIYDGPVELMDLFATIMELAGVEARHTHFAKSLMPVLRGETTEHREFACSEGGARASELHTHEFKDAHVPEHQYHPRITIQNEAPELHGKAVMLRTREWKYVRRLYDTDELYDLKNDPDELVNLIDDPAHAGVVLAMSEILLTWFLDTGDSVPFDWNKRTPTEPIWEP